MLKRFVVNDSLYKGYALKICGCKHKKDDLVNEMYIRLHDILTKEPTKEISNPYIYSIIRSIFIDEKRNQHDKNGNVRFIYLEDLKKEHKQEITTDTEERKKVNDNLNKLTLIEREILLQTRENSLREVGKRLGRSHQWVHVHANKALKKLKDKYNG